MPNYYHLPPQLKTDVSTPSYKVVPIFFQIPTINPQIAEELFAGLENIDSLFKNV